MSEKIDNQSYFNHNATAKWEHPPIVVAWDFLSAENLGALLRVCDNFGVKKVYFVGDEQNYKVSKIKRNATTSFKKVDWQFVDKDSISEKLPKEVLKIAVDTTSESISINEFDFKNLSSSFCLFFGNENLGLEDEVIKNCETSIHIPMIGDSFSMNVVQSAAVVLFEATRQSIL